MNDLHSEVGRKSGVGRKNGIPWRSMVIPLILFMGLTVSAQAPKTGFTRPLADVKFPQDDKPDCLQFALENGDLKTGPSTAIMKAAPKCVVLRITTLRKSNSLLFVGKSRPVWREWLTHYSVPVDSR